jgi:hypothetical protein
LNILKRGGKMKKVMVFTNGPAEKRMVYPLLREADIPFTEFGPTSMEKTPILEYGYWRFHGINSIKKFVEKWKQGNRPSLDFSTRK